MKLSDLFEAPLGDLEFVTPYDNLRHEKDYGKATGMSKRDARPLLNKDLYQRKLRNLAVNLNLYIINNENYTSRKRTFYKRNFEKIVGKPIDSNAINFIMYSNITNKDRYMPLTPWIVCHRLGHAIRTFGDNDWKSNYITRVAIMFEHVLNSIIRGTPINISTLYNRTGVDHAIDFGHPEDKKWKSFDQYPIKGTDILTSKAAREDNLPNSIDWFEEVFAQYMIEGKVRLNQIGNDREKALIAKLEAFLNKTLSIGLRQIVGEVYAF